jgi:hypothetical protein
LIRRPWGQYQQVVPTVTRTLNQILNKVLRRFPVVVTGKVSPTVVDRHAGLPIIFGGLRGLFGSREISSQQIPIIDDDVRLETQHHVIHLL